MQSLEIKNSFLPVLKQNPRAVLPKRASDGAAGMDLYACLEEEVALKSCESKLIPTGIAMSIPSGFVGLVFVRSSLGAYHSVTLPNCVGVIDSDYRGEVFVSLKNFSQKDYTIKPGDRIAQIVITSFLNIDAKEVAKLDETKRSQGGFGSTGR